MRRALLAKGKVVLVVGASSGFGKACAIHLARCGYDVYATSRSVTLGSDGCVSGITMVPMDVRSEASVAAAVKYILGTAGQIDVVINSAGIGYAGAVEDMSMDEFYAQLDTNFFGVVRVTQAVLPLMREQGSGLFINISSIGGFMGLPFQSAYSASKFALEGFTESLRIEAKPFGIKAVLLQPGDFKTGFTNSRLFCERNTPSSVYYDACTRAIDVTINGEVNGASPDALAKRVASLIEDRHLSVRYSVGPVAQRLAAKVKYWMPSRVFERLISHEFKQS